MFSERPPLTTGAVDDLTLRKDESDGGSASVSITASEGHALIPLRAEGFGSSPTSTYKWANSTNTSGSGAETTINDCAQTIVGDKADGFSDQLNEMTAANDSDAASGDTAAVRAYEFPVEET